MTDTVIFDLDGTLLNTLDDIAAALAHAIVSVGRAALDTALVRRFVGNGVPKLILRALFYGDYGDASRADEESSHELLEPCLAAFTEYYNVHSADKTALYPDVAELLEELKKRGYKTAVNTNKYDGATQKLKREMLSGIDIAVGTREGISPKPSTDGVDFILRTLGTDRSRALYVGDGEVDIATAKNAGLPVVAVTWGFRDRPLLEGLKPDYIIDSPLELLAVLFERNGGRA